ncbi:MAG TPA: 16S rRNA (cytidine(1402)-2'-O)-methyltransferase [Actinomycetota bacterium]|nr:16S rRNA (cytidine(1402)-2'-O)-methyltransferase [Actinomycetota bacterium]
MPGKLILCGTPIGNLEDMSARAVRVLSEADVIACEDTRRTRKLLSHFGIAARSLVVYNEANERRKAPELLERIQKGSDVVLVSDAGMPGLSDPGFRLVRACVEAEVTIEVVPGPSAVITALAVSGLAPGRFVFEGFLPRKSSERRRRIEEFATERRTIVVFESTHRLAAALADLHDVLGDLDAVVAREMTKMHEEIRRGTIGELAEWAATQAPKGEMVVVISGAIGGHADIPTDSELARRANALMDSGTPRSTALSEVARSSGVRKRQVFDALLAEERDD